MARWNALMAVAVLALPAAAGAGEKKVPPQLTEARYVALGYDTGDRVISAQSLIGHPELSSRDTDALENLRSLVSGWDRFILTERVEQADILIAVRTSRRGSLQVAGQMGHESPEMAGRSARAQSPTFDGELSSDGDIFTVYESKQGTPGMVLWRERRGGGGDFPRGSFERFKSDVAKYATK